MQLTIERMSEKKTINTKYGPKEKCGIFCDGEWYDCWVAPWNQSWKPGETVTVEIQTREWEGKTYKTVKNPDATTGGGGSPVLLETLKRVEEKIDKLLQGLQDGPGATISMPASSGVTPHMASTTRPQEVVQQTAQAMAMPEGPPPVDEDIPF